MQKFDIREEQVISAKGRCIRFDSSGGNPINIRAGGQDWGQLWPGESLDLPEVYDSWAIKPVDGETGFVRIGMARINSIRRAMVERPPVLVMESGANAVTPGGSVAGWVSGTPASLAVSTQVVVVFDLGPDWDQYSVAMIAVLNHSQSTGGGLQLYGADSAVSSKTRLSSFQGGTSTSSTYVDLGTGVSSDKVMLARPAGRFVRVVYSNGSTAVQLASCELRLVVYPA